MPKFLQQVRASLGTKKQARTRGKGENVVTQNEILTTSLSTEATVQWPQECFTGLRAKARPIDNLPTNVYVHSLRLYVSFNKYSIFHALIYLRYVNILIRQKIL